jgi:hypothetical protein
MVRKTALVDPGIDRDGCGKESAMVRKTALVDLGID